MRSLLRFALVLSISACLCSLTMAEETAQGKVIACLGDSITYGYTKNPSTGEEGGTCYPDALQILLGADYEVVNLGKPGAFATDNGQVLSMWNQEVYQKALDIPADVFIVMLGTNDSQEDIWDEESYTKDYGRLLDSLLEAHPDSQFFVMTPPTAYLLPGKEKIVSGIQEEVLHNEVCGIVQELAGEREIPVIDLHTFTADHPQWFRDGVHPNDVGYPIVANHIYDEIIGTLTK